ncbi:hypothetical protein R3P38DRAFT_950368 [Favolaschia claudopus]|uniref:Uncharacterized protein n=1 Tax=Favolaschia claudopus TaxID=2862362 RepID=A0AAW0BNZ0_9AGAR
MCTWLSLRQVGMYFGVFWDKFLSWSCEGIQVARYWAQLTSQKSSSGSHLSTISLRDCGKHMYLFCLLPSTDGRIYGRIRRYNVSGERLLSTQFTVSILVAGLILLQRVICSRKLNVHARYVLVGKSFFLSLSLYTGKTFVISLSRSHIFHSDGGATFRIFLVTRFIGWSRPAQMYTVAIAYRYRRAQTPQVSSWSVVWSNPGKLAY